MSLDTLTDWLSQRPFITQLLSILGVIVLSAVAYLIARRILISALTRISRRTATRLDDILLEESVFQRLTWLVPLLILYNFAYLAPGIETLWQRVAAAAMAWVVVLVLGSALNVVSSAFRRTEYAERLDIKSYVQITKLLVYIFGGLVIIATLIGRSPWFMISGLGAMTAVLLLIFRDTLLSFVAGLQISSNDLVRIGDWIEVPAFGADGDVIDIALHTVKVQNWDKTVTVIPTYKLLDSSFKNWRGMSRSGGRRIKRAVHIDLSTIRLCDEEMLDRFESYQLIADYIREKRAEVKRYNEEHQVDVSQLVNGRRLTNIGTFRAYVKAYLHDHPMIHQEMTFLVRQLAPGPTGLPIEIYVFTNDTRWEPYEAIQADIFDHILAIVPAFGLRVYQEPAGKDFRRLVPLPGAARSE